MYETFSEDELTVEKREKWHQGKPSDNTARRHYNTCNIISKGNSHNNNNNNNRNNAEMYLNLIIHF